jgi:chemotaxis protein CheC
MTSTLTHPQMQRLQDLTADAVANISRGLTEMFNTDVAVTALHVRTVPLNDVSRLIGDPELEVVGVYLVAEGDMTGQMLLILEYGAALQLCDMMLEQPPGTTTALDELETSALAEMGNIVGSFFLNSFADSAGLRVQVSPPGVLRDMAGAAVDVAVVEIAMTADDALLIDANFEYRGRNLPAWFLAFPDPEHLDAVLGAEAGV